MEIPGWREEPENILSPASWVFKVRDGCEIREADLLEETLLGCRFVEGKEVWTEDEVEGFPLLCNVEISTRR